MEAWARFNLPSASVERGMAEMASAWLRVPRLLLDRSCGYCAKHVSLAQVS